MTKVSPAAMEATIRRYFAACNAADYAALVSCFVPDAVHYFPHGLPDIPWRGADHIARKWIWCVETFGSRWTIEKVLCAATAPEAVIEWTHWKPKASAVLRGDEWYVFCERTGLIREIRAYYAAAADSARAVNELPGFDYRGRGYNLAPPDGEGGSPI